MKRLVRRVLSVIAIAAVIALASCGGGNRPQIQPPIIATAMPPAGTANVAYPGFTFTVASGGQAPFTWSETGSLPLGLALSSDGLLSGVPTSADSFPIMVTVTDSSSPQQTVSQSFTIVINKQAALVINTSPTPPTGTVGNAFPNFTFSATGGIPPLTWSETGALPPGLTFSSDGLLSGIPTSAGSFLVSVSVHDSLGESATPQSFTIQTSGKATGFIPAGSMESPRESHTATLLKTGKVLVSGGVDNNNNTLGTAELFDPSHESFTATDSMGTARSAHTATLLNTGKVLVIGGVDNNNNTLATADLFDPDKGTFTPTGTMESARFLQTATLLKDGKVLVTGGVDNNNNTLATAELFDPGNESFTAIDSMGTARSGHTATLLNTGKVLVTGGVNSNGTTFATAELFDPEKGTFTPTSTMESARLGHTATLLDDGTVLIAGGAKRSPVVCGLGCVTLVGVSLSTVEIFDPATETFTPTGSLATARSSHTATLLNDDSVLITGGVHSTVRGRQVVSNVLSTTELFQ